MGFGYADKLSYREDLGGSLGDSEFLSPAEEAECKIAALADLVRSSSRITVFTGAGISKAAGVPDFRGPTGIWTLQRDGKPIPPLDIEFGAAKPTVTHQALVALQQLGKLTCVISQNVDGLHTRSGIDRDKLAELHGCCFVEKCGRCGREYFRDFEMDTVGFKRTGRVCDCGGRLRDQVLDWEDALPEPEYEKALAAARNCDVFLCLGSSLRITPACEIPVDAVKAGAKLVIVNLQKTMHDAKAHLHLHAKAEDVMSAVARQLNLRLPDFQREDAIRVTYSEETPASKTSTGFSIRVSSSDCGNHVTPLLQSLIISFPDEDIDGGELLAPPLQMRRRVDQTSGTLRIHLELRLKKDADSDKRFHVFDAIFRLGPDVPASTGSDGQRAPKRSRLQLSDKPQQQEFRFVSQNVQYNRSTGR